jgi:hypothetical protein
MGRRVLAYSLKDDDRAIAWLRETDDLVASPRLEGVTFGTGEWWAALDSGAWPTETVEGVITRTYEERQGDWPRFELMTASGLMAWTREGDPAMYRPGQHAEVRYFIQSLREPAFGVPERPVVITIWLQDGGTSEPRPPGDRGRFD